MKVSTVNLEFLREGTPHGQLLSPLTRYLATMGSHPSASVTLPFDQLSFDQIVRDLRYQTDSLTDADRRRMVLDTTGQSIARTLASVPGVNSSLNASGSDSELLHLRFVLSCSELATIPWELSKDPNNSELSSESWLALQARNPTVITRQIRSIGSLGAKWDRPPKVLFISSDAGGPVPFEEHRDALLTALDPWTTDHARHSEGHTDSDLLTVLNNASYQSVAAICAEHEFTHVHILAHGDEDQDTLYKSFGLALHASGGGHEVVSGERFIHAIRHSDAEGTIRLPTVVTVAGCDSGGVGSLVTTGASFAHALHEGGIPFVVASQFPLSIGGSVTFVSRFYEDVLWAYHPLWSLYRIRAALFGHHSNANHDWVTLVVYESLPADFEKSLLSFRYMQSNSAISAALNALDAAVEEETPDEQRQALIERIERARKALPMVGSYAAESGGLAAASNKRQAEIEFHYTTRSDAPELGPSIELLKNARTQYDEAMRVFIKANSSQSVAQMHWLGTQIFSLDVILGRTLSTGLWQTVRFLSTVQLEQATNEVDRAWAHGTLVELYLLATAIEDIGVEDAKSLAMDHLRELLAIYPSPVAFPHYSTRRQLARYVNWWGSKLFVQAIEPHMAEPRPDILNALRDEAKVLVDEMNSPRRAGGNS